MINFATRPPLGGRVQPDGSRPLGRRVKLNATLVIVTFLGSMLDFSPAYSQQQSSLCILVSNVVNGVNTTSCVPVSAANPLPATVTGTSTATLTAGTTPTSGFTNLQPIISSGGLLQSAAGVSCAANSVTLATLTVTNGIVTHC
jgi:hypothetical protein